MNKLGELRRMAMDELEKLSERGLSPNTAEVAKNYASLICKLDCIEEACGGEHDRSYSNGTDHGYSRRRDSMGRYSRDGGYSNHKSELERIIEESDLRPETKQVLRQMLERG